MQILDIILKKALDWVIGTIMISIVLILFIGVILRYLFNAPIFGSEEVAVIGLVWIIFLGGAILVREEKHVAITFLTEMLRPSQEKVVKIIGDFLILSILVIMVYQSWKLSSRLEESTTPALSISEAWFGRAMIVGFIIMLYYKVRQLSVLFFGKGVSSDEAMEETGDQHE